MERQLGSLGRRSMMEKMQLASDALHSGHTASSSPLAKTCKVVGKSGMSVSIPSVHTDNLGRVFVH